MISGFTLAIVSSFYALDSLVKGKYWVKIVMGIIGFVIGMTLVCLSPF